MNTTHTAVAWRPVAPRLSLVAIVVAAFAAIGFFVTFALPYLRLDPAVIGRYSSHRLWLLAHIGFGAVALISGPMQLWLGLQQRALWLHRRLGLVYVVSVGIGATAAFYLAAHTRLGWVFGAGITGLGIAWTMTTALAVAAIRRGSIEQHKEWMVRSYVVTFAFVTFRALWGGLQAAGIGTLHEQLGAASWFCWAVPLLVTEVVLQGRKIFREESGIDLAADRLQSAAWPAGKQFAPPPGPTSR